MSTDISQASKKNGLIEYLSVKTTLPSDLLSGGFRIEVRGRNSAICFGCRRIVKYTPDNIVLAAKDFTVGILGEGLICTSYHEGAICIEGFIRKIEFDPDNKNGDQK